MFGLQINQGPNQTRAVHCRAHRVNGKKIESRQRTNRSPVTHLMVLISLLTELPAAFRNPGTDLRERKGGRMRYLCLANRKHISLEILFLNSNIGHIKQTVKKPNFDLVIAAGHHLEGRF